jgi:hypothetical protein
MAEQTIVTTQPAVEDKPAAVPSTGGFAPQISTHPVATLEAGGQGKWRPRVGILVRRARRDPLLLTISEPIRGQSGAAARAS